MLIAVNPFRTLPLYGAEQLAAYADEGRRRGMPPHIFKLAARAFAELQLERRSQAILVSGESGAGKTETAKAVLKILSVQSAATAARAAGGSECACAAAGSQLPASSSSSSDMMAATIGRIGRSRVGGRPRNAAFAAGRARMHGSGMQASACDLQSKIRLFLRHFEALF